MSDSFFGAGFSNDSIAREREAYRSSNPNDMDAQLESMALGNNNLGDRLDEDLDVFNDETFDGDIGEIAGREFDFFQSTSNSQAQLFFQPNQQQQQQQQQNSQPQQGNLPQLFQKMGISVQTAPAPTSNGPSSVSGNMSLASAAPSIEQRMPFSFAELESQALHRQATPIQVNQPFSNTLSLRERRADPEVIAQRREERLRKQEELSRYNNMMSRHDKDYIVKIQVSQLLTDDPAADDFYCHMYQLSRGALFGQRSMQADQQQQHQQQQQQAGTSAAASSTAAAATGYPSAENVPGHVQNANARPGASAESGARQESRPASSLNREKASEQQKPSHYVRPHRSNTQSSMARMQQQVQRIVNEARRRPKSTHVLPEGVLGKISVNSARNPKQVIQVQRSHAGSISSQQQTGGSDPRFYSPNPHDLGGVFSGLGDARNPAAERRKTLRSIETIYDLVLRVEQLIREQVRLPLNTDHPSVQKWISSYNEAKERMWAELDASQPISNTYPHPLVRFLAFSKGKRIIPRLVHHLSIDQVLALTTTIIANFESLDVCRFGSFSYASGSSVSAQQREETDLFLHAVMPPTLAFLSETPLQIINGLFALFMERNNVSWVVRTRPALVFLTVILGRSSTLRQSGAHGFNGADQQDEFQAAELYSHLFNSLHGGLSSIFPPPALSQLPSPLEDLHAWQFLAALASGASVDQQHALVAEVREKVLEKVQLAKSGRLPAEIAAALISNVNLFLNALGLDASQVSA
ncbi:DNA topoisomerase 2-associated protein pat1 [Coemansia sp. RSA 1939]|nr:DNA topoisomerase 2-associated protein pat1 [Coemansia sp. RSA 1939]KAJ2613875.1 DNA topoisomerase 2-associated protein pat1 [Coemansia sp. RSA 1804]